jgi:hypothetical protein
LGWLFAQRPQKLCGESAALPGLPPSTFRQVFLAAAVPVRSRRDCSTSLH